MCPWTISNVAKPHTHVKSNMYSYIKVEVHDRISYPVVLSSPCTAGVSVSSLGQSLQDNTQLGNK